MHLRIVCSDLVCCAGILPAPELGIPASPDTSKGSQSRIEHTKAKEAELILNHRPAGAI